MKHNFAVTRREIPKEKPNAEKLGFGLYYTDHMFMMAYRPGKGWIEGRIVPYDTLCLDPATSVFHYGMELFEGMKAYKAKDGRVLLFRPEMNAQRANVSADRLCFAQMDTQLYLDAVKALVHIDRAWIPEAEGTSLYIRPFMIVDEVYLGLRPPESFLFVVILSPVGSFYEGGFKPTKLLVEDAYTRAAPGGTGYAKVGGNYAGSIKALKKAKDMGCDQVLWLDSVEKKYIEEVGAANVFFVIDGEIITPPAGDTILNGVTRDSAIALLKKWGQRVSERSISIDEVFQAGAEGRLEEAFTTGTATLISPIGELVWKDSSLVINGKEVGRQAQKLYDTLYGIQTGAIEDTMGWTVEVAG